MSKRKVFYLDLLERVFWTFGQSFVGTFIASALAGTVSSGSDLTQLSVKARLSVALAAGGVSAAKCFLASKLPWTADDSGSTLPADLDPPQDDAADGGDGGDNAGIYNTPKGKDPEYPGDHL